MTDDTKVCPFHSGLEIKLDALCEMINERDKNYHERDLSNKEAIKVAFNNSERASEKTEAALKEYKNASNEWRDTVKDLVNKMITRPDVERELKVLENKISDLKEYRNRAEGRASEKTETRTQANWSTGLIIVAGISALSLIVTTIHMIIG